jgi:hypothetical protein
VIVRWPSGLVRTLVGVTADQRLTVIEQGGVGVASRRAVAPVLELSSPVPNPSRGPALVRFSLPAESPVRITLHDLQGRAVATPVNAVRTAGWHVVSLPGRDDRGARLIAGVYVVKLEVPGEVRTRALVIIH